MSGLTQKTDISVHFFVTVEECEEKMGRREQNKSEKRAAILHAAWQQFVMLGYETTSVVSIVEEAGMARGTFYQYHRDKRDLFEALLESLYQPLVTILEDTAVDLEIHGGDVTAHQKRSLRTAILLATHLEERKAHWPIHFRTAWSAGIAGDAVRAWRGKIEDLATRLLESAQGHGLLRPYHPRLAAFAFVGATERLIWAWLNEEIELSRRELAQQLAQLFWDGLSPRNP